MSRATGTTLTIVKEQLDGSVAARYPAEVVGAHAGWLVARASWGRPRADLGYLVFEPEDVFIEYFALSLPVNAFAIYDAAGQFKGWYCNVAENRLHGDTLTWRDQILDLIVYPNGDQRALDEDELDDSGLAERDPARYRDIRRGLDWLRSAAARGVYPFSEAAKGLPG